MDLEQSISWNPVNFYNFIPTEAKLVKAHTSFNPESTKLYVDVEWNFIAKLWNVEFFVSLLQQAEDWNLKTKARNNETPVGN